MARLLRSTALATAAATVAGFGLVPAAFSAGTAAAAESGAGGGYGHCSAGAHSLSPHGARVYPETGNGGYRSVHTDVHMVYDAGTQHLPGRQQRGPDRPGHAVPDQLQPRLRTDVGQHRRRARPERQSVTVNGRPARFTFAQPTYPGDPKGLNDPDPLAHQASQHNPVGGPDHNPLPPACTPELNGRQARGRPRRHPVPGQQAGHHPLAPDPERPAVHRGGQLHRQARRAQRR